MTKQDLKNAQELWAINKYLVLSKSQSYYLKIRDYLKRVDANKAGVEIFIGKALSLEESPKDVINACQHIWGYFKDEASSREKEKFLSMIDSYKMGEVSKEEILEFLYQLLEKYPSDYLEKSTIFDCFK